MELVAGYPFWLIKNGLPYQYPKLLQNTRCDVAIVGGGISGALTAWYCVQAGIDCMLVDARSIALGSTSASTSLLQYELDTPLHKLKKLVGDQNAVRAYQLCGEAIDKLIELMDRLAFKEYSRKQSLFFSSRRKEKKMLDKECRARKEAGFEVQLLSKEEMKCKYGLDAVSGILSEKGASNDAYLFTHKILQDCITKGLRVFDRTPIKNIRPEKRGLILTTDKGYTIAANYMVNATGYEIIHFINKKIVNLDCTYAMISESMAEQKPIWGNNVMMWNTEKPYMYMCPANENRILIGGADESFVNIKTMHNYLEKKSALLKKSFDEYFPSIHFKQEFAWSGVFGKTKDSLPYIGPYLPTPRVFYALGFGGNGITFSLVAAEIIRDLLLGKKNKDADIFSFSR
ncbi:MAG TPA: FAD-dependent oxidoreductase [Chitinophagaceae bacterium]|jgi:glycine/D-amino acid oxidase-like deaminating enzyme